MWGNKTSWQQRRDSDLCNLSLAEPRTEDSPGPSEGEEEDKGPPQSVDEEREHEEEVEEEVEEEEELPWDGPGESTCRLGGINHQTVSKAVYSQPDGWRGICCALGSGPN